MRKINYILMTLVATLCLAACSVDDTPRLTSTVAPVLSDLSASTIVDDSVNSSYTFNWTAARFYLDNNVGSTSIGSFDNQGINYDLQIDTLGGDFSKQASVGQVVSKLVLPVTQAAVQTALFNGLGIAQTSKTVDVIFRVVARYSGVDSLTLVSNTIQSACKLVVAPPAIPPKFYIRDNAGYGDMYLYAWNTVGNMLAWPGAHYTNIIPFKGTEYYEFDLPSDYIARPGLNFIANNNGGAQMDIVQNYTFSADTYVTLNADGTFTVDEKPGPLFFICDNAGWGGMNLYAWNETGNMLGWPGVQPIGTVTLNGKDYYEFDMPSDYIDRPGLNFIANDGKGVSQLDIVQNYTFSDNVYITIDPNSTNGYSVSDQP